MSIKLRTLPKNERLADIVFTEGTLTKITMPILDDRNTRILFDKTHFGWRYDGKSWDEETMNNFDPKGEHYMEKLRDDEENPYTEHYVSIGHCTHGIVGDALLVNNVAVEIKDTWVEQEEDSGIWLWALHVQPMTC